jgi:hypothetical protein
MHALWYVLPVTVVGVVVLFIIVGLRYLYQGKTPPLWVQFACIVQSGGVSGASVVGCGSRV